VIKRCGRSGCGSSGSVSLWTAMKKGLQWHARVT
jgi:hypothetical protein